MLRAFDAIASPNAVVDGHRLELSRSAYCVLMTRTEYNDPGLRSFSESVVCLVI